MLLLGDSLEILSCFKCQFYIHEKPCPDCKVSEQPPASDFTEECRKYINHSPCMSETTCKGYADRLKTACICIDRQVIEIKKYIEIDKYKSEI